MFGFLAIKLLQVAGASWRRILIRMAVVGMRGDAGIALMPLRTWAAHVVTFGPIAQRHVSDEPAPQRGNAANSPMHQTGASGLRRVSLVA
jgi:hypothetical protein